MTEAPTTSKRPRVRVPAASRSAARRTAARRVALRRVVEAAMELERRAMLLYCKFENRFADVEELRGFWFDMAQHESRHFGALALVAGLLERSWKPRLHGQFHAEADKGLTMDRAFAMAVQLEGSEIEDVVLDLLHALHGESEHDRAIKALMHDLGDLGYMIEKHTADPDLLARADLLLERQVGRLRSHPLKARRRARHPTR
jgi:rubrerythrin